jgi:hypothetical protein
MKDEYEDDIDRDFENKYDKLFGGEGDGDERDFERDVITGRKNKRPKMSVLNKGKVSKQEMDDLFLEY